MTAGWIKLHRKLLDKAIWKQSTTSHKVILVTLLMMANHKYNEWHWQGKKFCCRPGQFITSINSIAKKAGTGISPKMVRNALLKFEKYEFLANQSAKTGRLITIVNWDVYQTVVEEGAKEWAERGQTEGRGEANKGQSGGKCRAPNKNDKNDKNDKNNIYTCDFAKFWLAYPRKLEKIRAFYCWQNCLKDGGEADEMIQAAENYARYCRQERIDVQYIKHPSTFLSSQEDYRDWIHPENGELFYDKFAEPYRGIPDYVTEFPHDKLPF